MDSCLSRFVNRYTVPDLPIVSECEIAHIGEIPTVHTATFQKLLPSPHAGWLHGIPKELQYNTRRILAARTPITDYLLPGSSLCICLFGSANAECIECRPWGSQVAAELQIISCQVSRCLPLP
jgi:hypothetical protein